MRITQIETRIHRSPFTYGVGLDAGGGTSRATGGNLALKTMDTLLVKVETDQGIHGWGEGFGFTLVDTTRDAVDRLIAPACIGQDARDIGAISRMLQKRFHNFGRNGPVTFGISAIDIALWDITGKFAGKPLHALLGDAGRPKVRAYASLLRYGNPEDVARNAAEAVRRGHRHVGFVVDDPEVASASRTLEGLRGGASGVRISVIRDDGTVAGLREALHGALRGGDRPTCLLVAEADAVLAVAGLVREAGMRVPEDVSLVSWGQNSELAWHRPAMAHFTSDQELMVRRILRWIRGLAKGRPDHDFQPIPLTFVAAGTTGPAKG
jgi:L-alanine-DL-glutamate epimerase-like enolase superfamily enzyme